MVHRETEGDREGEGERGEKDEPALAHDPSHCLLPFLPALSLSLRLIRVPGRAIPRAPRAARASAWIHRRLFSPLPLSPPPSVLALLLSSPVSSEHLATLLPTSAPLTHRAKGVDSFLVSRDKGSVVPGFWVHQIATEDSSGRSHGAARKVLLRRHLVCSPRDSTHKLTRCAKLLGTGQRLSGQKVK